MKLYKIILPACCIVGAQRRMKLYTLHMIIRVWHLQCMNQ